MHFPISVGVIWVLIVVLPCTDHHKYLTRENRITMDRLCGAKQRHAAINQQQYSLLARVEKSSLSIDSEVNPCFGEKTLQLKLKGRWTEYMSRGWKVNLSIFPILRYPNEGICLQKNLSKSCYYISPMGALRKKHNIKLSHLMRFSPQSYSLTIWF